MPTTMQRLPTEILLGISEILDIAHPPSVLSFARANKYCYLHASSVLFRTLKVPIGDGKQRFEDLHCLEKRLLRDDAFGHVRRLILHPCTGEPNFHYLSLDPCERGHEKQSDLWSCWDTFYNAWAFPIASITNDEWEPVARLVRNLTGLSDLFWVCTDQFPPCLLQMLHEKHRLCRLHHYTFNMSSQSEESITSHERALLTSPCLYTIADVSGKDNLSASRLARCLQTPNLRIVYLCSRPANTEPDDNDGQWPQLVPREFIQLDGSGTPHSGPCSILQDETSGDFSALRVLRLNTTLVPLGLPAPSAFPSLVTLTFTCARDADAQSPYYWDEITTFLRELPHLTTLEILGWDRTVLITPALSSKLRKLDLSTPWRPRALLDDDIHRLAETCPNLEYLAVAIQRSRGDAAEIARYRALGRLPRLQELCLCLVVSPPGCVQTGSTGTSRDTIIEPRFGENDSKYLPEPFHPYREGHIRDLLVNSAIDASLARSIYGVIDGAKPIPPGRSSPLPLECLELRVDGGEVFPGMSLTGSSEPPLNQFLCALNQHWLIERDIRDDSREVVHVSEIRWREDRLREKDLEEARNDRYWFGLWRRVWPIEREGIDWWDDWESRPLDLEADVSGRLSDMKL